MDTTKKTERNLTQRAMVLAANDRLTETTHNAGFTDDDVRGYVFTPDFWKRRQAE